MIFRKVKGYLKDKWPHLTAIFLVMFVGPLLALITFNSINTPPNPVIVQDTICVPNVLTDSLLEDISEQVHQINTKIPYRKPGKRRVCKPDTLRIDASIHLDDATR